MFDIELNSIKEKLQKLELEDRVSELNKIRMELSSVSPFGQEPVERLQWVKNESVVANDYNPNTVAPPEMKLLELSIMEDGYTQPIVAWGEEGFYEVVDGFHRNRVGKESPSIHARIHGYLPIVIINDSRLDLSDRMAATIRHNRARGKHRIESMSDIVIELKRRNWTDTRIANELGMDQDEILRLCQITGLSELFSDQEFSKSWDVEGEVTEIDFEELTDDIEGYDDEIKKTRTVNTSDETRIFHTYEKWECYKAGFYDTTKPGMTKAQCEEIYRSFLSDTEQFAEALKHVIVEWKHSCEHYLTNSAMNRIAWLGQAACCYAKGIPAVYRGGFSLLTQPQQDAANQVALDYLNQWLSASGREPVSMEEAYSGRQSDIY